MKNVITWFDVPTSDFNRAIKFYSEILGEEIKVDDSMGQKLGLFPMERDMTAVGGDIVLPDDSFKPGSNGTRVYLNCAGKLDDVIGRVVKAGGKIVREKTDIGDPGYIAMIQDTEGNIIGLHSPK